MLAKAGKLASPTVEGNQAITGVGFRPKAIIFWPGQVGGINAHLQLGMGWIADEAAAADDQLAAGWRSRNNHTVTNTARGAARARTIFVPSTTGASVVYSAACTIDNDGFTLNWTTIQVDSLDVHWLALGGSGFNAESRPTQGALAGQTSTESLIDFLPNAILALQPGPTGSWPALGSNSVLTIAYATLGFCDSALNQRSIAYREDSNSGTPTPRRSMIAGRVMQAMNTGGGSAAVDASVTEIGESTTPGMFFFRYMNYEANNRMLGFLPMQAPYSQVGAINQSAVGVQSVELGFKPKAVLFLSQWIPSNSNDTYGKPTIVAVTEDSSTGMTAVSKSGVQPTAELTYDTSGKLAERAVTGGTILNQGEVTLTDTGFEVNWDTVDTETNSVYYMALGDATPAGETEAPRVVMII